MHLPPQPHPAKPRQTTRRPRPAPNFIPGIAPRSGPSFPWFVTGFPAPGKVCGSHSVLPEPALSGKKSLRWRGGPAKAGNMAGTIPSAVSCRGPITPGLGRRTTVETATCPRRRLVNRCAVPASSRVAVSAGRYGYSYSLRRRCRTPSITRITPILCAPLTWATNARLRPDRRCSARLGSARQAAGWRVVGALCRSTARGSQHSGAASWENRGASRELGAEELLVDWLRPPPEA